jgi:hypothetical protein
MALTVEVIAARRDHLEVAPLAAADGAWERRSFWAASASSTAYAYVPGKPAVETHRSFTGESVLGLTMSPEENKAITRRFVDEVQTEGNIGAL